MAFVPRGMEDHLSEEGRSTLQTSEEVASDSSERDERRSDSLCRLRVIVLRWEFFLK